MLNNLHFYRNDQWVCCLTITANSIQSISNIKKKYTVSINKSGQPTPSVIILQYKQWVSLILVGIYNEVFPMFLPI